MITLNVIMDGTGILAATPEENLVEIDAPVTVAALEKGMESGRPSVAFIFDMPDGRKAVAQTSLRLLLQAARILEARFGPQDAGDPVQMVPVKRGGGQA